MFERHDDLACSRFVAEAGRRRHDHRVDGSSSIRKLAHADRAILRSTHDGERRAIRDDDRRHQAFCAPREQIQIER